MSDGFDISNLTGKAREIATKVDNANVKDGKLSGKEISIFFNECESSNVEIKNQPWYFSLLSRTFSEKSLERGFLAERPDALNVVQSPAIGELEHLNKIKTEAKTQVSTAQAIPQSISTKTKVKMDTNTQIDSALLKKAFNNVIAKVKKLKGMTSESVLLNMSDAFLKSGLQDRGLNPFVLMGIAIEESAAGCSKAARQKKNIAGLRERIPGKNAYRNRTYDTVPDSINAAASTVQRRYNEGYDTIHEVAYSGRYCGKNESAGWEVAVSKWAEMIRVEYNRLLKST